jgi:hypothetical protein
MFRLEARSGNRNDWLGQFDASRPDHRQADLQQWQEESSEGLIAVTDLKW